MKTKEAFLKVFNEITYGKVVSLSYVINSVMEMWNIPPNEYYITEKYLRDWAKLDDANPSGTFRIIKNKYGGYCIRADQSKPIE